MLFLSDADSLNETVLEHLARIVRLQVDEKKAVLAFRNVLQKLLDLVRRVVTADLLNNRFSLQSVAQRRPDEEASEINSDDVSQRAEFLGGDPQISPKMSRSDGQRRD